MKPFKKQMQTEGTQVHTETADAAQSDASPLSEAPGKTVIAQGMALSGHLRGNGTFCVEGTVEGSIEIAGVVVVAVTGTVRGPIHADSVYVGGCVEGNIFAKDLLQLEMTGDISGNIMTASFLIYDGGQLNGCCTMTRAGQEPTFLY